MNKGDDVIIVFSNCAIRTAKSKIRKDVGISIILTDEERKDTNLVRVFYNTIYIISKV
jgi:hypothetical protein